MKWWEPEYSEFKSEGKNRVLSYDQLTLAKSSIEETKEKINLEKNCKKVKTVQISVSKNKINSALFLRPQYMVPSFVLGSMPDAGKEYRKSNP